MTTLSSNRQFIDRACADAQNLIEVDILMPRRTSWLLSCLFLGILLHPIFGFSQTESAKPFSRLGIAVTASTLGFGAEAASPLSSRFNLRAGFNLFNYDRDFHEDGVAYTA